MEKNKTKVKLRRAKTPDNKNRNYTKNEILIELLHYITKNGKIQILKMI